MKLKLEILLDPNQLSQEKLDQLKQQAQDALEGVMCQLVWYREGSPPDYEVHAEYEKVDVNLEPLIDQVEGPILVADFLRQIDHNLSAEAATASCLITFHRRGSGPHTVTNPNGTFIVGDFVTCAGRTYSITS